MRRLVKIILWTTGSILGLVVLLFGVLMLLLTPSRLTPIVNSVAEDYLNASVSFEEVDVSLFADFPRISIALKDAVIVSHALGGGDTLVTFNDFAVSLDALKLMSGKFVIRSVRIVEPTISGRVDSLGVASWDILKDKSSSSDTTSTDFDLQISSVDIVGESKVELVDERNSTLMHVCWSDLSVVGRLTNDIAKFSLLGVRVNDLHASILSGGDSLAGSLIFDSIRIASRPIDKMYDILVGINVEKFVVGGDTLVRDLRLGVGGGVYIANQDSVNMDKLTLSVNDIVTQFDGLLVVGDSTINSNVKITSPSIELAKLLTLVPGNEARAALSKVHSNINFGVDAVVTGSYNLNSGSLPDIMVKVSSANGMLSVDGAIDKLERFSLSATLSVIDGVVGLMVEDVDIFGSGIDICAKGRVDNLLGDPYVDASLTSKIDLDVLMPRLGELTKSFTASGVVGFEGSGKFRLSQLNLRSLASTTIEGKLSMRHLKLAIESADLKAVATGSIFVGTSANKQDSSMAIGLRIVGLRAVLDTIDLEIKGQGWVNGRGFDIWATTAASAYAQRGRVHPFRGRIKATRMDVLMIDSSRFRLRGFDYDFRVTPDDTNDTIPILHSDLKATSLSASLGLDRSSMRNLSFVASAQVVPRKRNVTARKGRLDSLQRVYPQVERDSLMRHSRAVNLKAGNDELASGDIDMKMGGEFLQLLRRWSAKGNIKASRMRLVTPYIPLRTNVKNVDIGFDNNRIDLNSFHIDIGRSSMNIKGSLSNLRQVFAGRGVLQARLDVTSDTLDFTQIITSLNAGAASHAAVSRIADSLGSANISEEQMSTIIAHRATQTELNNLIIVPKNLDLKATLKVGKALYGAMIMDSLQAELISKNHILQIKKLYANSNIGRMSLGAIYSTRSLSDISTSFDLELVGVKVDELIGLMPDIDTLLPMMSSFEGIVDCKFAARASLDTAMNILIPSLDAAGSITGRNMVLLDGHTFTEIAKMLKFKNRDRNHIDSISVEMRVKDSKVEIYPFILTLDRYKTAVSGVQHLDMSFDYHISVIKSIVPFRLGINIFGNLDDWKFRLVKAKYKDENLPSYTQAIDNVRINLRHEIESVFTPR